MMNDLARRIATFADARGLAGRETAVAKLICETMRQSLPDACCNDGTVIGHIGTDCTKPKLMFCAHLDQVGFVVTDITDDGFLRIGGVGGIDRRLLLGQTVKIVGRESLFGVISILPPHLLKGEQAVPTWETLCVDTGFSSKEALEGIVQRGDAVYFDTTCQRLQNGRLTGFALDNRCSVVAVLDAAARLAALPETSLPCTVTVVCSAQEERGSRGARIAAQTERPDAAIAVDVTFAVASGDSEAGCFELTKGPAIGISAVLSETLSQALIATARAQDIPYQVEVMPDSTGTDADELALAPGGAQAATISIPLRYMHTPVEVIACEDVARTADLLVAFARGYGAK